MPPPPPRGSAACGRRLVVYDARVPSKRPNAHEAIERLLEDVDAVTNRQVVAMTGRSRQAVQATLQRMVATGALERLGAGRATHYRRAAVASIRSPTDGLAEHELWEALLRASPRLDRAPQRARSILAYAVTEMVNNVIDHSGAAEVEVRLVREDDTIVVEVSDAGVGAVARVRIGLGLEDAFAAVQQLSKGKVTTDPQRHTGEGLFFASKAVDYFVLESNGLRWSVDAVRSDEAVGRGTTTQGTRVRLELSESTGRQLADVFAAYTDPETLAFTRTRTTVRLYEQGVRFVSRSEGKRLVAGLDRFSEVDLDFGGVHEVGQGFVDEVFRVWARRHAEVTLRWFGAVGPVEAMIRRGLPGTSSADR